MGRLRRRAACSRSPSQASEIPIFSFLPTRKWNPSSILSVPGVGRCSIQPRQRASLGRDPTLGQVLNLFDPEGVAAELPPSM